MLGTVATIAREEGLSARWKGIVPGLHRHCLYGGLRIELYEPVKTFYVGRDHIGHVPLSKKVLAALTTDNAQCWSLCYLNLSYQQVLWQFAVANPTDLVKVRLQAEGKLPPGVPRCYSWIIKCVFNNSEAGRSWSSLDWAWPQYSKKCYHQCC